MSFTASLKRARDVDAFQRDKTYNKRKKLEKTEDMEKKAQRSREQGHCEIRNCPCACHK